MKKKYIVRISVQSAKEITKKMLNTHLESSVEFARFSPGGISIIWGWGWVGGGVYFAH